MAVIHNTFRWALIIASVVALQLPTAYGSEANDEALEAAAESPEPPDGLESPPLRAHKLVEQARKQDWSADQLLEHLQLSAPSTCLDFTSRAALRERHARWREAVELLDRIDPDALDAWLMGEASPPRIAAEETKHQLHCLFAGLFDAVGNSYYDIQLFLDVQDQTDGNFSTTSGAVDAAERRPNWFDYLVNVLTRSVTRDLHGQAGIWRRKFVFYGRPFNRISRDSAEKCGLGEARIWNPENNHHRHCWFNTLSPDQREREILLASAGPGLSRHHWGTDVDILTLNPVHFDENGLLHDDWRWLDDHALDYGFFQPYRSPRANYAHMEERWHWSYYPIAQALWDFVYHHQDRFEEALFERWDRFEAQWNPQHGPYFDHLRARWRDYFFHIHLPPVDATSPLDGDRWQQHQRNTTRP